MRETAEDLARLQRELDESSATAGEHVRSIFRPQRRLSAPELVQTLKDVFVLQLATVTAAHEPFLAPIDGLFYRGRVCFGVPRGAVRIAHLRARPQVSATYTLGEAVCVIVHGTAREIRGDDPLHEGYLAYCRETYGEALWDHWKNQAYRDRAGEDFTAWIEPRRIFAMGPDPEAG